MHGARVVVFGATRLVHLFGVELWKLGVELWKLWVDLRLLDRSLKAGWSIGLGYKTYEGIQGKRCKVWDSDAAQH